MFKPKKILKQSIDGFTLVEVIVGILLTEIFAIIAIQTFAMAVSLKVKAQDYSEATNWIQEDLEGVQYQARQLDYVSNAYSPNTAACSGSSATVGYGDRFRDSLTSASTSASTTTYTAKQTSIGSRSFTVIRTLTPSADYPYNVLELTYNVYSGTYTSANPPASGTSPTASLYTEVIPYASFSCL